MITKKDIRNWLKRAEKNHTHMIVIYDAFDYDDYPIFVSKGENVNEVYVKFTESMQNVMEVYDLKMDLEEQLNEQRAFHF